jgi:hypothetical protein
VTTVGEMKTRVDLLLQELTLVVASKGRLCKCCNRRLVIRTKIR